ncbi:MAG: hypothetical protein EZS28_015045, partial [Streblomastix strix]
NIQNGQQWRGNNRPNLHPPLQPIWKPSLQCFLHKQALKCWIQRSAQIPGIGQPLPKQLDSEQIWEHDSVTAHRHQSGIGTDTEDMDTDRDSIRVISPSRHGTASGSLKKNQNQNLIQHPSIYDNITPSRHSSQSQPNYGSRRGSKSGSPMNIRHPSIYDNIPASRHASRADIEDQDIGKDKDKEKIYSRNNSRMTSPRKGVQPVIIESRQVIRKPSIYDNISPSRKVSRIDSKQLGRKQSISNGTQTTPRDGNINAYNNDDEIKPRRQRSKSELNAGSRIGSRIGSGIGSRSDIKQQQNNNNTPSRQGSRQTSPRKINNGSQYDDVKFKQKPSRYNSKQQIQQQQQPRIIDDIGRKQRNQLDTPRSTDSESAESVTEDDVFSHKSDVKGVDYPDEGVI